MEYHFYTLYRRNAVSCSTLRDLVSCLSHVPRVLCVKMYHVNQMLIKPSRSKLEVRHAMQRSVEYTSNRCASVKAADAADQCVCDVTCSMFHIVGMVA